MKHSCNSVVFNSPLLTHPPFLFLMVAKSCCYLLYTSFQASYSLLDFLLLKPLVQTGSSFASRIFPSLASWIHTSVLIIFIQMNVGKEKKKSTRTAIIRSRSPSYHCLSLPTSLLWSSFCASLQL